MIKHKLHRRGVNSTGLASLIVVSILMITLLTSINNWVLPAINTHRPVFDNFSVTDIDTSSGFVEGHVYVHKKQDCYLVPNSIKGYVYTPDQQYPALISFINDVTDETISRPPSPEANSFGTWVWSYPPDIGGVESISFQASHICYPEITLVEGGTSKEVEVRGKVRTSKSNRVYIGE